MQNRKVIFIGLSIWCIVVLYYILECLLRVLPNTISDNLMASFQINAEKYSYVGSAFFLAYALMQLSLGPLINKFGVRKLLFFSGLICSFAIFWFSFSNNFFSLIVSRLLMGFAASFAFISLLALTINWFPKNQFAFFSGLSQFIGSLGPLLAGAPLAYTLKKTGDDWRLIFIYLGIFSVIITILMGLFIRNKPKLKNQIVFLEAPKSLKNEVISLLKNTQIWLIFLYTGLVYCSMPILGTYWGILFLQSRGFDKVHAAFLISIIWIGYATISPILGKLSDLIKRRIPIIAITSLLGFVASALLLYYPSNNYFFLLILLFSIGIASAGQSLSFVLAGENVRPHVQTTVLSLNNLILMLLAAFIPLFIGALIHTERHMHPDLGYLQSDFTKGLTAMPILYLICFFITTFGIKETFCRSQYEVHHLN